MRLEKSEQQNRVRRLLPLLALSGVLAIFLLVIHLVLRSTRDTLATSASLTPSITQTAATSFAPPVAKREASLEARQPATRLKRQSKPGKSAEPASGTPPDEPALPADGGSGPVDPRSKISPELLDQIDRDPGSADRIPVILQTYVLWEKRTLQSTILEQRQASATRELSCIGAWAVELPVSELIALASNEGVRRISSDAKITAFSNVAIRAVGADQVWPSANDGTNRNGVDGTGITVAILDSGGKDDLPDLKLDGTKRITKRLDFAAGKADGSGGHPEDKFGHATHVAGIIGGDGERSADYNQHFVGVAPRVNMVTLKVLDDTGAGQVSNVIIAIGWCIDNKATQGIRVINLSLGHPVFESYRTDPLTLACSRAVDAGIVVVAAAGNQGWYNGGPIYGGINSPGNAPWVITVGSTDTQGTVVRSDDTISPFSSRGPTLIDGLIKPDIVAPGRRMVALLVNKDCTIGRDHPELLVFGREYGATGGAANDTYYLRLSGTSMATPVVSGAVALMLQKNPSLTPNTVKAILMYTAEKLTTPSVLDQGAGYLNVEGAVRLSGEILANSNEVAPGTAWLRNGPSAIRPVSTIGGEAILWGSALLWGNRPLRGTNIDFPSDAFWGSSTTWSQAIIWARTSYWNDPLIGTKQAAYTAGTTSTATVDSSRAILWSNAIIWSRSDIVQGSAIIWSRSIFDLWNGNLVDPTSVGGSSTFVTPEDESTLGTNYVIGPVGSWYYPAPPQ